MLRYVCAIIVFIVVAAGTAALALTAAEKMETCKFGADADKLAGAKRKQFITKCMADTDAPAKPAKAQQKK